MTIVPDITLQFLKWRYQSHPGAKRAYEWLLEFLQHQDVGLQLINRKTEGKD